MTDQKVSCSKCVYRTENRIKNFQQQHKYTTTNKLYANLIIFNFKCVAGWLASWLPSQDGWLACSCLLLTLYSIYYVTRLHHYNCEATTTTRLHKYKRKQGKIVIAFIWHCYCLVARVVSLACDKKRGQYHFMSTIQATTQRLRSRLLSISFIISFPSSFSPLL